MIRIAPLTLYAPGCLLPLAGRPLLEYTLEVRVTSVADPDPYVFGLPDTSIIKQK
jgi:hypothetical protein